MRSGCHWTVGDWNVNVTRHSLRCTVVERDHERALIDSLCSSLLVVTHTRSKKHHNHNHVEKYLWFGHFVFFISSVSLFIYSRALRPRQSTCSAFICERFSALQKCNSIVIYLFGFKAIPSSAFIFIDYKKKRLRDVTRREGTKRRRRRRRDTDERVIFLCNINKVVLCCRCWLNKICHRTHVYTIYR